MKDSRQDILTSLVSDPAAVTGPTGGQPDASVLPRFTDFDTFNSYFTQHNISLRNQLRIMKKHAKELVNVEDAYLLRDYFRAVAWALKELVDTLGPDTSDEAIEGIDYPVNKKDRNRKSDDIIIDKNVFDSKNDAGATEPFVFMRFRCVRTLDETFLRLFNNHLDDMVREDLLCQEDLPRWRYFFGLSATVDDPDLLQSQLLFKGNVKELKFWIQALYGIMHYSMPDASLMPKGIYTMPAVIVSPSGAGVGRKTVDGTPTTRDNYPTIVANTLRLPDRQLKVHSFTTTLQPTLLDAAKILRLLLPLGCKPKTP